MDDTRPLFRVGLLVLLGIGLLVVLTFLLGARRWFQPSVEVETYFNESVNGLEVGSPVKFRGVQIGEVSEVTVSTWVYQLSTPLEERHNYIIVRSVLRGRDMGISQATLREYLDRGLRFQTQLAGITGQLYLALDFVPRNDWGAPLPVSWTPSYPYIPSAPSLTNRIIHNAQSFLASLDEANIQQLARDLNALIVRIDERVAALPPEDVRATARNVAEASARIDRLLGELEHRQLPRNLGLLAERLRAATDDGRVRQLLARLDQLLADSDSLVYDNAGELRQILAELSRTLTQLTTLSATLSQSPSALVLSAPPAPVVLPPAPASTGNRP